MTKISSSLKKRVITAAILAPAVLLSTYYAPSNIFAILLLVFLALCAYEWTNLSKVANKYLQGIFIIALSALFYYLYTQYQFESLKWIFYFSGVWWVFILLMLKVAQPKAVNHKADILKIIQGVLTILPAALAMFFLHDKYGPLMIFYIFLIVWGADIGAYFSGKRFGKHKLAPSLSPGKTIEGVVGGLLLVLILSLLVASFRYSTIIDISLFVFISIVAACFSIVGDLYESLLKREAGLKDSSKLLPGHGGVLDRVDSLLAAAPLFLLFYIFSF